jgi:hypothetical protein
MINEHLINAHGRALKVAQPRFAMAWAGERVGDAVERSLIYCMKHPMGPADETPPHEAALFSPGVLSSWRHHYATKSAPTPFPFKIPTPTHQN